MSRASRAENFDSLIGLNRRTSQLELVVVFGVNTQLNHAEFFNFLCDRFPFLSVRIGQGQEPEQIEINLMKVDNFIPTGDANADFLLAGRILRTAITEMKEYVK